MPGPAVCRPPYRDVIVNLAAMGPKQPGQIFECDLGGGNTWRATGVRSPGGVGPGTGLVYDPTLDVFVLTGSPTQGACKVWLMKYSPAAP